MMSRMVFNKLLSSLGFGGVEVDTVLSGQAVTPGGSMSGQVHLRARGEVEITSIQLLLVASDGRGEAELARHPVSVRLSLAGGATQAVPFAVPVPVSMPFNLLYGRQLPGYTVGVRTEVGVAGGSARTDFDPLPVQATAVQQHIVDALGAIGCRFVRNELREGAMPNLPVPTVQAITFYAPIPQGGHTGPHIPKLTFNFAADEQGLSVVAELADRPGQGDHHRVEAADAQRLEADAQGWLYRVDAWVTQILEKLEQPSPPSPGAFLQPTTHGAAPHGHKQGAYDYGGQDHHGYRYGGYRHGVGSAVAAGVGGAAMAFLGGMMVGDMLDDAFDADAAAGFEDGGGDFGEF